MRKTFNTRVNILQFLVAVAMLVVLVGCAAETEPAAVPQTNIIEPTASQIAIAVAATDEPILPAVLPPPVVEILPTNTPIPATNTPVPTNTPVATNTPIPTNTPTSPPPTWTPVPFVPTSTPIPEPTATPVPLGANGIVAGYFNIIQDESDYKAGGRIWFEFQAVNTTGGPVPYNVLGVMPRKDGQDRVDWFQMSYGGSDSTLKPEGLTWKDNIKTPESGNYTLRLAVCFDGVNTCRSGGGTFYSLSPEVSVTIN